MEKKGFSLVQVMISAALLGGLSLVVMQIFEQMTTIQNMSQNIADELELKNLVRTILNDERHCRVSLAGDGVINNPTTPVTFYKTAIDSDNEGLDVELFLSNQTGTARSIKKLSGTDVNFSNYGKLKIKSIKLIMNNPPLANYQSSPSHNDIGIIRVVAEKKISKTKTSNITMDFETNVSMSTNSSRLSTILSCTSVSASPTGLTGCEWIKNTFTTSYRGYYACPAGKKMISGGCSCGGSNCGGGATPGFVYSSGGLKLTVPECNCTDWTCSNCNGVRINCTGDDCNAWSCSYTQQLGELYVSVLCCDI